MKNLSLDYDENHYFILRRILGLIQRLRQETGSELIYADYDSKLADYFVIRFEGSAKSEKNKTCIAYLEKQGVTRVESGFLFSCEKIEALQRDLSFPQTKSFVCQ